MRDFLSSIWTKQPARPEIEPEHHPALVGNIKADVVVVGAGITGLTAALRLAEAGRSVCVLDRGPIAGGDSSRTSGHLTEVIDNRYYELVSSFGLEEAREVATSTRSAIEQIAGWTEHYGIECEFERLPGYLFAESGAQAYEIARELKEARRAGLQVRWAKRPPLPFPVAGSIEFANQAQLHPTLYLRGLTQAILKLGGRIHPFTAVTEFLDAEPGRGRLALATGEGFEVQADEMVVATHSVVSHRFQLQAKIAAYRTYMLAAKVEKPEKTPGAALFWDVAKPYHYIRRFSASSPDEILIGGEDHKTGAGQNERESLDQLRSYARDRFGPIQILAEWSGQIYHSHDGLPLIGLPRGSKHIWVATGFSGTGLTYGTLAGTLIADGILKKHSDAKTKLFDPKRIKPSRAYAKKFIRENFDFPKFLLRDRLKPSKSLSTEGIERGEGKLIQMEGSDERVAVFRDESGALHPVSSTCTHLGCTVHFNSAERTWDCPCHGSRFSTDGDVLNGPARTGLERREVNEVLRNDKKKSAA